jgi:hypothetical protein
MLINLKTWSLKLIKTKFPNSSIEVSSLIYREDINVEVIRVEVNDQLRRLAQDNNFQFIDNSVFDSTCKSIESTKDPNLAWKKR